MAYQISHILDNSWLPLGMRVGRFLVFGALLLWFKFGFGRYMVISLLVPYGFFIWFRDVAREGGYQGQHTSLVVRGLKWGLVWFLFREVWFFFRIFWTFFHMRVSPLTRGRLGWPLLGIESIPPFQVPLLNTLILLISGVTATLAHHEILKRKKRFWLIGSALLGFYFLALQGWEYYFSMFTLSSRVFGSVFFMGTGFHGLHVCLGVTILLVRSLRQENLSSEHHFGLEFSLWYWHFVDVVWLFLFFWVYLWGCY